MQGDSSGLQIRNTLVGKIYAMHVLPAHVVLNHHPKSTI